jgi:hypothetical protein
MLADTPLGRAGDAVCASQWLRLQDVKQGAPRHHFYRTGTHAGRVDGPRDGVVPGQPVAQRPADWRAADRRLHLRQRTAGQALRHSQRAGRTVPAGDVDRSEPPRRARTGQHPAVDLDCRPHLAGAARQVGDGGAAGLAAAGAAAQRAVAGRLGEGQPGRQAAVGARAHGRAPQEPGLQLVPPGDRPARPRARELRRHRRSGASRTMALPSTRRATSTTERRWRGRPDCGRRC